MSGPGNGRVRYADAARPAREAQLRLAGIEREYRKRGKGETVPKDALRVVAALHALLPMYSKLEDSLSVEQTAEYAGIDERATRRGIAWLREMFIIDRPRTDGGRGQSGKGIPGKTRFLSDLEAETLQRRMIEEALRVESEIPN